MIVAGKNRSFINSNGLIYAWGKNNHGQLGLGNKIDQSAPQIVAFFSDKNVQQIICQQYSSFAIVDEQIYAWGRNNHGQLGLGHKNDQLMPQKIPFFVDKKVQRLISGDKFFFAIADNHLYSWGRNFYGVLGIGNCDSQSIPLEIKFAGKNIQQVACDNHLVLAVVDNQIYAWGYNDHDEAASQLGNNYYTPQLIKSAVNKYIRQLICGDDFFFVVTDKNQVYAWGRNRHGQLGIGHREDRLTLQLVKFFANKNPQQIICIKKSVFAIADGLLYAWGENNYLLGLESISDQLTPQLVKFHPGRNIQHLFHVRSTMFAIADEQVYMWGLDTYGIFGSAYYNYSLPVPQSVDYFIGKKIQYLFCGNDYLLAIAADKQVYIWGAYGQFRSADNNNKSVPQLVEFFVENPITDFSVEKTIATRCAEVYVEPILNKNKSRTDGKIYIFVVVILVIITFYLCLC